MVRIEEEEEREKKESETTKHICVKDVRMRSSGVRFKNDFIEDTCTQMTPYSDMRTYHN